MHNHFTHHSTDLSIPMLRSMTTAPGNTIRYMVRVNIEMSKDMNSLRLGEAQCLDAHCQSLRWRLKRLSGVRSPEARSCLLQVHGKCGHSS